MSVGELHSNDSMALARKFGDTYYVVASKQAVKFRS